MFTSFFIAVALWGTDPGIVFSDDGAQWAKSSVATNASRPNLLVCSYPAMVSENSTLRPTVVRAQTVGDCPAPPFYQSAFCEWMEEPYVQEFISAMNPFVDEQVKTLKNYYDPLGPQMGTGSNGPPGYRLGWTTYNDLTFMPYAAARGSSGNFSDFEWNSYLKYAHVIAPGVLFQGIGYFNARWWEGPGSTPVPGQVDQISTDLALAFFNDGPWSGQIAFHPQIVDTYEAPLDWNAFNFDGRALATYKASPEWSFVGGVSIWDRVDKLVIPTAGVIWTPNNRWEFRVMFPKTRVSYFLGHWNNSDHWIYGTAEYTAEAYQSYNKDTSYSDRIQITDDRLCLGLRTDKGRYTYFVEGGWVFNRQVKFAGTTPNFNLDDTALIRVGLSY